MSENPTPLYVVCSPRTRVGKTLVSRLLAEFYLVDYRHVVAFDLADEGPQLVDYLPEITTIVTKLDREEAQVLQIYERLIRETQKRNLYAGIHCASPVYAARMIQSGFRLVTIANDSGLLAKSARESVAGVWAEAGGFR